MFHFAQSFNGNLNLLLFFLFIFDNFHAKQFELFDFRKYFEFCGDYTTHFASYIFPPNYINKDISRHQTIDISQAQHLTTLYNIQKVLCLLSKYDSIVKILWNIQIFDSKWESPLLPIWIILWAQLCCHKNKSTIISLVLNFAP